MILVAGLSPAWQQILHFNHFELGEVNRAAEAHWCASGKAINVAVALTHLGVETRLLSTGGGAPLTAMQEELQLLGVQASWIPTQAPTRVCTTILSENCRTTELVENAKAILPVELDQFEKEFIGAATGIEWVVLSGSLPQGTPKDYYRNLIEQVSAQVILDVRGVELLETLPLRPFLVKPNREELAHTLGEPITTDSELVAAMKRLIELGAEWVCVTQGTESVWAASTSSVFRFQPVEVLTINPIGCGDCLTAGIALGLDQGNSVPDAIRLGIAAAADNASQLLPARLRKEQVNSIIAQVAVERRD